MKTFNHLYIIIFLTAIVFTTNAQKVALKVGTNPTTIDQKAVLEIESTTKGLLLPRMTTAQRNAISATATTNGMQIYDTTIKGICIFNGTSWECANGTNTGDNAANATAWSLTGNVGSTPATNFIGTTDNNDLIFKRNNVRAGLLGVSNISFGINALNPLSTGTGNTAIGNNSLFSNTIGINNLAIGASALMNNTSGNYNVALGNGALMSNIIGGANVAIGNNALKSTKSDYSVAVGINTLSSNTIGYINNALGDSALLNNVNGSQNCAFGTSTLEFNVSGNYNVAMGDYALYKNTASSNSAFGNGALRGNTSGMGNTAIGSGALYVNTTGNYNEAFGSSALSANTTGSNNVAIGANALVSNTSGSQNDAIGSGALFYCNVGVGNVAMGENAAQGVSSGNYNVIIGNAAGTSITTGSNNIIIGYNAQIPNSGNTIQIGNSSIVAARVTVPWTITSDRRLKTNIKKSDLGLDFINKLNPVVYVRKNNENKKTEYGFIAQEVEETLYKSGDVNSSIINIDDAGSYSVRYNDFIAPMVKAIQELQVQKDTEIKELKVQIEELKALILAKK